MKICISLTVTSLLTDFPMCTFSVFVKVLGLLVLISCSPSAKLR